MAGSSDTSREPGASIAPVSQHVLLRTEYAMFVLTTVFILARIAIHLSRRHKTLEFQDFFIYFAYTMYVGLWTEYIIAVPYLYRLTAFAAGEIEIYPTVTQDAGLMSRLIFSAQMLFYTCLFAVKLSLMTLYRKLLLGIGGVYYKIWWGIVVFIVLSWIGCIITSVSSCKSMKQFFQSGACASPEELEVQIISLYYSYAIDVLTDLMVMFLPIRLVWGIQMARGEKIGIMILFSGGFVCIIFATLRAVQIGIQNGKAVSPDPKWLTMWTVIEVSMAIIVGCSPSFASVVRGRINSKKTSYQGRYYHRHGDNVDLRAIGTNKRPNHNTDITSNSTLNENDSPGEQRELRRNPLFNRGITVTTTVQQNNKRMSEQTNV
ncbi:hypothetical protein DM02DRAFT_419300 [Periconia macrospinosa]|uniref:Rhodopsin domain-containing protein n=1 Tax=Periconia macrospinosa TaxID=97972 RepID=A0A2V1DQN0_9PLEO|nr:hypothetical protein DM02DRAFT_419300 [Periconia macrospinosa]